MSKYEIMKEKSASIFIRRVGLNKKSFEILAEKLKEELKGEKEKKPIDIFPK